jgi:hypothetical protein
MYVVLVTRNKSIAVSTLHSMMTLKMYALQRNEPIEFVYTEGLSELPKLMKNTDRILWFDYGTNLDHESLGRALGPFDKDIRVVVFPSVKEGVDWEMFKQKVGSAEPIHQRALNFDTEVNRKKIVGTDLHDVISTSASVWLMDCKAVVKKLKSTQKNLSCESYEAMFQQLKSLNLRIAALPSATVVRHYTYECLGNILQMPGLTTTA